MGVRFGKKIKICKGVSLNLSGSGVGLSVGPKGAKISTGPRGTRVTCSIPGTGVSYSESLSSTKRKYNYQEVIFDDVLEKKKVIKANSSLELELLKKEQLDKWENEKMRLNSKYRIQSLKNEAEIKNINRKKEIDQFLNILKFALNVSNKLDWNSQKKEFVFPEFKFSEPMPLLEYYLKKYKVPKKSFLEKIFSPLKRKRLSLEKVAQDEYEIAKEKYSQKKEESFKEYSLKKEMSEKEIEKYNNCIDDWKLNFEAGEENAMEKYIEIVLNNSEYPETFEREYEVEYFQEKKSALISLKLPSFGDISSISEFKFSTTKKEIIEKSMGKKEYNEFYKKIVLSSCLRTIYEIFESVYPEKVLDTIYINIWVDYVDFSTGEDIIICILSGKFEKEKFEKIKLENIEVEACCDILGVKYYKNFSLLKEIEPIL